MVRRQKKVVLGGREFLIICLMDPLRLDTEVFPGDPLPSKQVFSDVDETGYQHHVYSLGDHLFHPHGDAPNHQNPALKDMGFESFDIDYFFNSACLIDLSGLPEAEDIEGSRVIVEVKKEYLEPYTDILRDRGAVLIRTGYDRLLESNKSHEPCKIPYLTEEAGDFIAGFDNVRVVGTDSMTVDSAGNHFVHKRLKERLIVESLVNLYSIPKTARDEFDLQTSTVAVVGATGGPISAFAFVKTGEVTER